MLKLQKPILKKQERKSKEGKRMYRISVLWVMATFIFTGCATRQIGTQKRINLSTKIIKRESLILEKETPTPINPYFILQGVEKWHEKEKGAIETTYKTGFTKKTKNYIENNPSSVGLGCLGSLFIVGGLLSVIDTSLVKWGILGVGISGLAVYLIPSVPDYTYTKKVGYVDTLIDYVPLPNEAIEIKALDIGYCDTLETDEWGFLKIDTREFLKRVPKGEDLALTGKLFERVHVPQTFTISSTFFTALQEHLLVEEKANKILKKANRYYEHGNYSQAKKLYSAIIEKYHGTLAYQQAKKGIEDIKERRAERLFEKAEQLFTTGNYSDAFSLYSKLQKEYKDTQIYEKWKKEIRRAKIKASLESRRGYNLSNFLSRKGFEQWEISYIRYALENINIESAFLIMVEGLGMSIDVFDAAAEFRRLDDYQKLYAVIFASKKLAYLISGRESGSEFEYMKITLLKQWLFLSQSVLYKLSSISPSTM
ncbi:tetratricopeptide repeat protein [candidate division WOR-3 bacterium]|nr:tetratricopeptide repeat protein [candidate division WOR-3 bacterium]